MCMLKRSEKNRKDFSFNSRSFSSFEMVLQVGLQQIYFLQVKQDIWNHVTEAI